MVVPRRLLADCSPSTHCTASQMFDLPEPFGPTIAVIRDGSVTDVRSTNDLKPWISSFFRRNMNTFSPGSRCFFRAASYHVIRGPTTTF